MTTAEPALHLGGAPGGGPRVSATGRWTLVAVGGSMERIRAELDHHAADTSLFWDLRGIEALDYAGAALLWRACGHAGPDRLSVREEHAAFFRHLEAVPDVPATPERLERLRIVRRLGDSVLGFAAHLRDGIALLGALATEVVRLVRRPSAIPWREISASLYRTGTQALGITALVGFLVGVVLSYLSANQLKLFGADIFIVNILGISVTRELGPVLAAILVAGRSGSAMTAQLGVMKVTQELDAMAVMGIPQVTRLVLPKVVALAVALPLLILWTSSIALLGGMVAANAELGIGYFYFLTSLPQSVPVANFWLGIGKGLVFGAVIALVACHFGLRIRPNTESLGAGTTSSVVSAITAVILVDAVFAIAFSDVGLSF